MQQRATDGKACIMFFIRFAPKVLRYEPWVSILLYSTLKTAVRKLTAVTFYKGCYMLRETMARVFGVVVISMSLVMCYLPTPEIDPPQLPSWTFATIYAPHTESVRPITPIKKPSSTILCLAQVLFFEGRHEPYEGLEAIASTVFNRQTNKSMSVCSVVYAPSQYSWTKDFTKWKMSPPKEFVSLAKELLDNRAILVNEYPVTHFHRIDVHPKWANKLTYVGTFGQHKFYTSKL